MLWWPNKGLLEWTEDKDAYLSVVFSWDMPHAYQRAVFLRERGYQVVAGGPAVLMRPDYLADVADCGGDIPNALGRHSQYATRTSRGCPNACAFCAVPTIEGELTELHDWEPKQLVCDDNFLACSRKHFDDAIDRLKGVRGVDFNQGLEAARFTTYRAQRLAELDFSVLRLAWDYTWQEKQVRRAYELLRAAGIPNRNIRIYVLIGFDDTPEDALYRLRTIHSWGVRPFPMRFQPLDADRKNNYVADGWTASELARYTRYWSRLRYLDHIPFEEYRTEHKRHGYKPPEQETLF